MFVEASLSFNGEVCVINRKDKLSSYQNTKFQAELSSVCYLIYLMVHKSLITIAFHDIMLELGYSTQNIHNTLSNGKIVTLHLAHLLEHELVLKWLKASINPLIISRCELSWTVKLWTHLFNFGNLQDHFCYHDFCERHNFVKGYGSHTHTLIYTVCVVSCTCGVCS